MREFEFSPRIEELRRTRAVDEFWSELESAGTPLIEPGPPRGGDVMLLTLVWRGESPVAVAGGPGGMGFDPMDRVVGTDVWYRTYRVPADTLCTYQFIEDVPPNGALPVDVFRQCRPDPLNPREFRLPSTHEHDLPGAEVIFSVAELPGAPRQRWTEPRDGVGRGAIEVHQLDSKLLRNRRTAWVHTPVGYDDAGPPAGLLIVFDGKLAVSPAMAVAVTLDNLAAENLIPPLVTVLVDNPSPSARQRELPCYSPFADFVGAELVPWASERWNVTTDPARTVLAGASFGGVAAMYAALRHPDRFGNVLSNSGSFWWTRPGQGSEWLIRKLAASDRVPRRVYMDIGRFESGMAPKGMPDALSSNRLLREILMAKGAAVHYREFSGGHHPLCWRGTFADGIQLLTRDWGTPVSEAVELSVGLR